MEAIVKTLYGLENILAEELKNLGAENIVPLKRAVQCEVDKATLYRINYESRLALRVLVTIKKFRAHNDNQLYQKVYKFDWRPYLNNNKTFAIDSVVNSDLFTHSHYIALRVKDAIVDQFRKHTGERPSINLKSPHIRIHLHIKDDHCTLLLDCSGDSLHKRGYRIHALEAPLNEVLAAAMVTFSGWKYDCDFLDPMCGSGTIVIEAAMQAMNIPAQINRKEFCLQHWEDYDKTLWSATVQQAKDKVRTFDYSITGADKDMKAFRLAQENALTALGEEKINFVMKRFEKLPPPEKPTLVMMNPPYDERLKLSDTEAFYAMIGTRLKQEYQGNDAWVISSNRDALNSIGLRPSKKHVLFNGALECQLRKYEMYQGTRRKGKEESLYRDE